MATRLGVDVDVVDLLPDDAPVAAAYRVALEHFGGLERVFVLVEGPDDLDLLAVQEELAERLSGQPEIAEVRVGLEAEDEEFLTTEVLPRAPLLLQDPEWKEELARRLTPEALRTRARAIRAELLGPGGQVAAPWLAADPLGLLTALPGLRPAGAIPVDPATGAFRSADGGAALVVITPARGEIDAAGGRELLARLEGAFAELRRRFGSDLELAAVGGPLYAAQDEQLVRADLQVTVTTSAVLCALVLVLASGGWRAPLGGLLTVGVGLLWTAAVLALTLERVSAVGLAFAAVLIGLGLDYWIHGSARFADRPTGDVGPVAAVAATVRRVGPGILSSAVTTACGFSVLAAAHLRPIREIGVAVAVGMTAILFATATFGVALLVLGGRRPWGGPVWRALGRAVAATVAFVEGRPRGVSAVLLLVSVAAAAGLPGLSLEADLRGLRPASHPVLEAERRLLERFDLGLDTTRVVVRGDTLEEALESSAAVAAALAPELGEDGSVTSPHLWLSSAGRGRERLAELEVLGLGPALDRFELEFGRAGLEAAAFRPAMATLRELLAGGPMIVPDTDTWPSWLAELVRVEEDGVWAAVHVRTPLGRWSQGPPAEVLAAVEAAAPGAAVASAAALGAELKRIASADFERLAAIAAVVVGSLVLLSFRGRLRPALLAMLPVVLGCLWTFGLWGHLGGRLDVLSLVFLPILLGIGIDDGLHAVHAAHAGGDGRDLAAAVRETGRAMVLTSLTTIAGFSSLGLSHLPSLQAGGLLVAVGVAACLAATLFALPALTARRSPGGVRGRGEE